MLGQAPHRSSKEGCVHYSWSTKLMLYVSSQMNTLKASGTPTHTDFSLFCSIHAHASFCYVLLDKEVEFLLSGLCWLWFQSACTHFSFHSSLFSLRLSFLPSLFHLFTHLLEEGHNEINIFFSREKAVHLLFFCLLSSPSAFHIFLIIHFMKVRLREMPVCLLLPVYMPFHM